MSQVRGAFVRKMAKEVLRRSGIKAPPVDLKRIAEAHGIIYEEVRDFPDKVDALIIEDGSRTYAAVNANHHIHRQRFSLAHELGHYFLHRNGRTSGGAVSIDNPPGDDQGYGKDPSETEADIFAGELLVPLEMLKQCREREIPAIAKLFVVSEQVAAIAVSRHMKTLFK
jgi:Zn-dependent peptidase ImmA (M78 family)